MVLRVHPAALMNLPSSVSDSTSRFHRVRLSSRAGRTRQEAALAGRCGHQGEPSQEWRASQERGSGGVTGLQVTERDYKLPQVFL